MKLSVIVPTLDGRVPQSLRNQVAECRDVELVVVTGVSPVGRARNEGLRRAAGEWIAWVDSDDEVADGWLAEILAALADGPDVVTMDAERVGWPLSGNFVWGVAPHEVSVERLVRDVYRDIRRPSSLWLYVTRRELWEVASFDEEVRIVEDFLLAPHVLARARTCRYLPSLLYRYVFNPKSLINTQTAEQDGSVVRLWERRIAECPRAFLGPCRWGVAVSAYWICSRLALDPSAFDAAFRDNARFCRSFLRRFLPHLLRESLVARDLPPGERAAWLLRFATAAADVWILQRWRHRKTAGGKCGTAIASKRRSLR